MAMRIRLGTISKTGNLYCGNEGQAQGQSYATKASKEIPIEEDASTVHMEDNPDHGSKTQPSRRRVGRVVSVSARSETSPSHESVDLTQKRPTRLRIGVDSIDSTDSRPNWS